MKVNKYLIESYEWARIPEDIPKSNLVFVRAKTVNSTIHPEDPEYTYRMFDKEDLKEAARSLARRPVGVNHIPDFKLPEPYGVIDAQWNEETQSVEALLYLPDEYIKKIREGKIKHVSVEYYWRDELKEGNKVLLKGLVFDRVDLLEGMNPGDKFTEIKLVEGNKRLIEGEVKLVEDKLTEGAEDFSEAYVYVKKLLEAIKEFNLKLGEPLGPYRDFEHCVRSVAQKGVKNPEAYCGYLYWKIEKGRKDIGKKESEEEPKEEKVKIKVKVDNDDVKALEEEPKEQGNRTIDEESKEEAKVDVPETGDYIHVRVEDPDKFDSESFRYIDITEGVKAVVGCPKGQFEGGKCKVGTQVQKFIFDKEKFTPEEAKKWVEEHKREGKLIEAQEIPKDKVIATAQNPAEVTHPELKDKQIPEVPSNPMNTGPMSPPVTPEKTEEEKKVMIGKAINPTPEVKNTPPVPAVKVEEAEKKIKELQEAVDKLQKQLLEEQKKIQLKIEEAKKEAIEQERKRVEEQKKKEFKILRPAWFKEE